MLILPVGIAIREVIKRKISIITLVVILIFSILVFLITASSLGGVRCYPAWKGILIEMRQLSMAQKMFYEKNNRYADTQEELIATSILGMKLRNRVTNKEFTDIDGKGIEGGDDDPKTWLATTYLQYKEFNMWCIPIEKEYWFICNQDGCHREESRKAL